MSVYSQTTSALAIPGFDDAKAMASYLAKAEVKARLAFYEGYFQKAVFDFSSSEVLASSFAKDFETAPADQKIRMARALLIAPRRAETVRSTSIDGLPNFKRLYFGKVVELLPLLSRFEETAAYYYQALPFPHDSQAQFSTVHFDGNRAALALSLLPKIGATLTAEGKRLMLAGTLSWPSRLNDKKSDLASLRGLQKELKPLQYPFLTAVSTAATAFSGTDWKAFISLAPDEEELSGLLPGIFTFTKEISADNTVTGLKLRDTAPSPAQLKALLAAAKATPNGRLWAMGLLYEALRGSSEKPGTIMADAVSVKDDWTSFCLYRVGTIRGATLTDAQLLACLDPSRPSLAAAVLEDRYADAYFPPSRFLRISADPAGEEAANVLKSQVLKGIIAIKNLSDPRMILPLLETLIFLGESKYIVNVFVWTSSSHPSVRNSAFRGMLNFADTSMFKYFLASLGDLDQSVRNLGIKGLGAIKDSRGIDPLVRILNDPYETETTRTLAAIALGDIGDRRLAQIFMNVLLVPRDKGGDDWNVRIIAAQSLGILQEKSAVDALLVNIDPEKEDLLNYYCLEALGKIDNPDGYRKLVPIVTKGWETWILKTGGNSNLYAAEWALFLFKNPEAEKLFKLIWEKTGNGYSDAGYMAAYALARNAQEVMPAWSDYLGKYRQEFFSGDNRVYEFARLLKGRWDIPTLVWLGSRLKDYSAAIQSWILSDMHQQPDFLYLPVLALARTFEDEGVRAWAAKVAYALASSLPRPPNEKSIADALSLAALLDGWSKEEKSSRSLSWLADARKMAVSYVENK